MAQDHHYQQQTPSQVPSAHANALADEDTHQPWYTTGWYTHPITGDDVSRDCIGETQYMPYQYERCVASSHQQVHYFELHDGANTWQAEPPLDQTSTAADDVHVLLDLPLKVNSDYHIPGNLIDIPQICGQNAHEFAENCSRQWQQWYLSIRALQEDPATAWAASLVYGCQYAVGSEDWKDFVDLLYYLLHKERMILNAALQGLRCVSMRRQLPIEDVDQGGSPFDQFERDFHAWFRCASAPEPGADCNWMYCNEC